MFCLGSYSSKIYKNLVNTLVLLDVKKVFV